MQKKNNTALGSYNNILYIIKIQTKLHILATFNSEIMRQSHTGERDNREKKNEDESAMS